MREEDLKKTLRAVGYYDIDSKINIRLYNNIRHSCFFFLFFFYQELY